MLNKHSRTTLGKCAADLYEAGNRRESLILLRQLAEASEYHGGETDPPLGWCQAVETGKSRVVRTLSNRKAAANVR